MKKGTVIGAFHVILILAILTPEAKAFWVWTKDTGKWVNPRYVAKETAEEQFQWALEFYEAKDFIRAIEEWRKLIKNFPGSGLASEAQYHIGLAYQGLGEHYDAFLSYQKVLEDYPQNKRVKEIIEKEYQMANLFYTARKSKLSGIGIPSKREKSIEIFRKVIENAPYGDYAVLARYKIGSYYMDSGRYQEAISEFEKVIDDYPSSELLDDAKFQMALCFFKIHLRQEYDQEALDKAIGELEDFLEMHPSSNMVGEAQRILTELNEKKAEHAYKIAQFYERQGVIDSAVVYYKEVRDEYSNTSWAGKALERLIAIEKERGS